MDRLGTTAEVNTNVTRFWGAFELIVTITLAFVVRDAEDLEINIPMPGPVPQLLLNIPIIQATPLHRSCKY
jgi:hypothetical protein